jgi:DNA-directed RNA polymerase subunit K/omega
MDLRKSRPILSKYEKTTIIGTRMEQLQRGAEPLIDVDPKMPFNPRTIAVQELREKKLPLKISRSMPDGSTEEWKIEELYIPPDL